MILYAQTRSQHTHCQKYLRATFKCAAATAFWQVAKCWERKKKKLSATSQHNQERFRCCKMLQHFVFCFLYIMLTPVGVNTILLFILFLFSRFDCCCLFKSIKHLLVTHPPLCLAGTWLFYQVLFIGQSVLMPHLSDFTSYFPRFSKHHLLALNEMKNL